MSIEGGAIPANTTLSISDRIDGQNWYSGGSRTDGSRGRQLSPRIGNDGLFLVEGLSPISYGLYLNVPGYASVHRDFRLQPGARDVSLSLVIPKRKSAVIEYMVSPDGRFDAVALQKTPPIEKFSALDPSMHDRQFRHVGFQSDGELTQLGPTAMWRMAYAPNYCVKVGSGSIETFRHIDGPRIHPRHESFEMSLEPDGVYLMSAEHRPGQKYWVLFRVASLETVTE